MSDEVQSGTKQEKPAVEPNEDDQQAVTKTQDSPERTQDQALEKESNQTEMEMDQGHDIEPESSPGRAIIEPEKPENADAEPESRQERIAVEPAEALEKPSKDEDIEQIRIEIPGISERRQHFPSLSTTERNPVSLAGSSASSIDGHEPEVQETSHPTDFMKTSVGQQRTEIIEIVNEKTVAVPGSGTSVAPSEDDSEPNTNTVVEGRTPIQRKVTFPTDFVRDRGFRANEENDGIPTSSASPYASIRPTSLPNRSAAERIEQLRHRVQDLVSKVTELEAKLDNESRRQFEQVPSPPGQPVVIVKRATNRGNLPRAFWERSYLSRFRLRPLR